MSAVRVLIADDHPVFRAGLRALMSSTEDLDVVAEAGKVSETGHSTATAAGQSAPGTPNGLSTRLKPCSGPGVTNPAINISEPTVRPAKQSRRAAGDDNRPVGSIGSTSAPARTFATRPKAVRSA